MMSEGLKPTCEGLLTTPIIDEVIEFLQEEAVRRQDEPGVEVIDQWVDRLREFRDSHEQTIHEIRKRLWLGHGHVGLYGDDGEMQCSLGGCMLDFKRDPLDKIIDRLNEQREQTIQQLRRMVSEKQDEVAVMEARKV